MKRKECNVIKINTETFRDPPDIEKRLVVYHGLSFPEANKCIKYAKNMHGDNWETFINLNLNQILKVKEKLNLDLKSIKTLTITFLFLNEDEELKNELAIEVFRIKVIKERIERVKIEEEKRKKTEKKFEILDNAINSLSHKQSIAFKKYVLKKEKGKKVFGRKFNIMVQRSCIEAFLLQK